MAPTELETQIAKRVGVRWRTLPASRMSQPVLTEGNSHDVEEFRLEVDTQKALNDVKDAVRVSAMTFPQRSRNR